MKNYLLYITAAVLFAAWAFDKYTGETRGSTVNVLLLAAIAILLYKLLTAPPRYKRRGFRP